jgi:ParB-like chromosome segregation protein Spo0J
MPQSKKWKVRIVGRGDVAPDQLLANPLNHRIHPMEQQRALLGVLAEVGMVQSVIVNRRTGRMIDGHARAKLALRTEQKTVPVVYVDLSEEEERKMLAAYDEIGRLAGVDEGVLRELLEDVRVKDPRMKELLASMRTEYGVDLPAPTEYGLDSAKGVKVCLCKNCGNEHAKKK